MTFKIATWNVNSLRVRLAHVLDWINATKPDILALQETKLQDADFPVAELKAAGYEVLFSGQRTYNGMAILSRVAGTEVILDLPGLEDPQRRVLAATIGPVRLLNLYIPNGESIVSPKYQYKMDWLAKLKTFLQSELEKHPNVVVLGDFNIAPEEQDVFDPKEWVGQVLVSEPERAAFQDMLSLGLHDCFRKHEQPEKSFSWWDYRLNAFKRNRGLRIDHILASEALISFCSKCLIDKEPRGWERPSDHTPVVAEFTL